MSLKSLGFLRIERIDPIDRMLTAWNNGARRAQKLRLEAMGRLVEAGRSAVQAGPMAPVHYLGDAPPAILVGLGRFPDLPREKVGRMVNRRDFLRTGLPLAGSPLLFQHPGLAQAMPPGSPLPPTGADGWVSLLNGRDLSGWYTMLQKSGRDVAQDRKMVVIEEDMLHILGNEVTAAPSEAGYIATDQEFENVHIRVEYKWGVKRFPPRTLTKRDNGLLYGLVGADKVWPTMVECQIEEGDVGDYFLVGGIRGVQHQHGAGLFGEGLGPNGWTGSDAGAGPANRPGQAPAEPTGGRKIKDGNFEKLDDWNVVEVIWQGDRSAHIVNGRCVNVVSMLQQPDPQNPGQFIPLTRGKIAIEIEFAEIWYRRIEVRSLA